MANPIYKIPVKSQAGKATDLSSFSGKVMLIVNTASKCGYTPQYKGLEGLYKEFKDKGLVVLGFPSNDFGAQEPGTDEEIHEFCEMNFGVTFPLFAKGPVKGSDKQELFKSLTSSGDIKWNFEKFLVDRTGNLVKRFESSVKPEGPEIKKAIEEALRK